MGFKLEPPKFEEPIKLGEIGDILATIQSHYWTKINKDLERPNIALMTKSWHLALDGLSKRAIESALVEWVKTNEWPPQASDLRKLAIRQGATIYDPKTVAYVKEQYERALALQAGDE